MENYCFSWNRQSLFLPRWKKLSKCLRTLRPKFLARTYFIQISFQLRLQLTEDFNWFLFEQITKSLKPPRTQKFETWVLTSMITLVFLLQYISLWKMTFCFLGLGLTKIVGDYKNQGQIFFFGFWLHGLTSMNLGSIFFISHSYVIHM